MRRQTRVLPYISLALALTAVGCKRKETSSEPLGLASSANASAASSPASPQNTAVPTAAPVSSAVTKHAENAYDAAAVQACCTALHTEAGKRSSKDEKAKFENASHACTRIADMVKSGRTTKASALGEVRAAAKGGDVPSACH